MGVAALGEINDEDFIILFKWEYDTLLIILKIFGIPIIIYVLFYRKILI